MAYEPRTKAGKKAGKAGGRPAGVPVGPSKEKRDRKMVVGHLPLALWKLMEHRRIDDELTMNQVIVAGCLAYTRGELRIDGKTGRYMVQTQGPDIVGSDESEEGAQKDEGASLEQAEAKSTDAGSWDRRTDDRGVKLMTTMHVHRAVEEHLGRSVTRSNVRDALKHHGVPMNAELGRYEWAEDDPEWAKVVKLMTTEHGYEKAINARLRSLMIDVD